MNQTERMEAEHEKERAADRERAMDEMLLSQTTIDVSDNTLLDCSAADVGDALDRQVGGDHYKGFKIQPIEFFHANGIGYCEAAIIKYVLRFRTKGGREDLAKARHCIDLLEQMEYGEGVQE